MAGQHSARATSTLKCFLLRGGGPREPGTNSAVSFRLTGYYSIPTATVQMVHEVHDTGLGRRRREWILDDVYLVRMRVSMCGSSLTSDRQLS